MNNIFNNLTSSLSEEFKKFDLNEAIQLSMSKIAGYDLQINNLVKYNKSNFFDVLQENVIKTINSSNIFLPVEKNDLGFLNLSLNHIYLMKNITNTRSDFKDFLSKNRPQMASFYKMVRIKMKLLIDKDSKPVGGKWSFDSENRKKIPASVEIPKFGYLNTCWNFFSIFTIKTPFTTNRL